MFGLFENKRCGEKENGEKNDELVSCATCKCKIDKSDAVVIKDSSGWIGYYYAYYCQAHKPLYTEIGTYGEHLALIRIDEHGIPVGYIKQPEKKDKDLKLKKDGTVDKRQFAKGRPRKNETTT